MVLTIPIGKMSYIYDTSLLERYFMLQHRAKFSILKRHCVINTTKINNRTFKISKEPMRKVNAEIVDSFEKKITIDKGPIAMGKLWGPFYFTIGFTSLSFVSAAIYQYERTRRCAFTALQNPFVEFDYKFNKHSKKITKASWKNDLKTWWNSLTEGERMFIPLCLANVIVFCAWRVPKFLPVMAKYFCSNPASKTSCWPMFLSTFSHCATLHLFANMYVLYSFCSVAVATLSKEEFLALYISAGVVSSFASYIAKAACGKTGLTLGASGAIMGIIGFVCSQYPDTKLSIIFLPWMQFSADTAIKGMMALDIAGVLLGWRLFDHAAHIGGGLAGITWCCFGHPYLWQNREYLLKYWNKLRTLAASEKKEKK